MKKFYVTFGMGTIFRGYHAVFEALDAEIVRAFMNHKVKAPWSNIYDKKPKGSKALQAVPEVLCYQRAEDVR